jgi:hypothetical protein
MTWYGMVWCSYDMVMICHDMVMIPRSSMEMKSVMRSLCRDMLKMGDCPSACVCACVCEREMKGERDVDR